MSRVDAGKYFRFNHSRMDEPVLAELREDSVNPGIDDPVVSEHKIVAGLSHDPFALEIDNLEIFYGYSIPRIQESVIELL